MNQSASFPTPIGQRPSAKRFVVLTFLCAAAAIAYISRNSISVPADAIREELGMTATQMGWVLSAFYWTYALAQIPSSAIGHALGTRRALSVFAVVWSAAGAVTGLAFGFWSFLSARLVFGVAQAGIFPCAASSVSKWFPATARGFPTGLLGSFMSIGGAIGVALTGVLIQGVTWRGWELPSMSWRLVFALYALPGLVWSAVFYVWFRDRPEEHSGVNEAELALIHDGEPLTCVKKAISGDDAAAEHPAPTPWLAIATSFSMWMICGQQFFRAAGYIFYVTWFPTYLQRARGVKLADSGLLASLPLLSFVLGCAAGGVVVDWVWRQTGSRRWSRQGVAIIAMLGGAACTLAAYFVVDTTAAVLMISLGTICVAFGGSTGYTVTIDKGGDHVAPVFGTMNMSGNFGAAICPIVVGMMFDAGMLDPVLLLVAGIYVAAAICWALLNPNGTIFDDAIEPKPTPPAS